MMLLILLSVSTYGSSSVAQSSYDQLQDKMEYEIPTSLLAPVRNQGRASSCTYQVVTDLVIEHYLPENPELKNKTLSVSCLMGLREWMFRDPSYVGADKPSQSPLEAGDDATVAETISNFGIPFALDYSATGINCTDSATGSNQIDAKTYQNILNQTPNPTSPFGKGLKARIEMKPTLDFIRNLISRGIPVGVGTLTYLETKKRTIWGWSQIDPPMMVSGAHAIQLVGYTNNGYFKFKNSWGTTWGNSGYGFVSVDYLINSWSQVPRLNYVGYIEP